jgi:hypothetical protein
LFFAHSDDLRVGWRLRLSREAVPCQHGTTQGEEAAIVTRVQGNNDTDFGFLTMRIVGVGTSLLWTSRLLSYDNASHAAHAAFEFKLKVSSRTVDNVLASTMYPYDLRDFSFVGGFSLEH